MAVAKLKVNCEAPHFGFSVSINLGAVVFWLLNLINLLLFLVLS